MKKWILQVILGIIIIIGILAACSGKKISGSDKATDEKTTFPEHFEKTYDKLDFDAEVVIPDAIEISQLKRRTGRRAFFDNDKAYDRLFQNIKIDSERTGEILGDNGEMIPYKGGTGTNNESVYVTGQSMSYSLPFSSYIWHCIHPEKKDSRYNMDKYELNGELPSLSSQEGYEEILSLLKDIDFTDEFEFQQIFYALDYKTLEQEEYSMDIDGNEDTSVYKDTWSEADNCYYYSLRQIIDGLPLYYVYADVFKELDVINTGINAIYSRNGLQQLTIDKLFTIDDSVPELPVTLLPIDELAEKVEEQYEMIISDAAFEVSRIELFMMAEKEPEETYYNIFPVWIMQMEQIQNKDGEVRRTPLQSVIDAVTGDIIS